VIGTQFSNLVKQFVSSFVNPLLSLMGGTPDFGNLTFRVGKAIFTCGQFVTAALSFVISALMVYFILVMPVSRLLQMLERNRAATTRDCIHGPRTAANPWPRSTGRALSPRPSARRVRRFPPGVRRLARPGGRPSRRPGVRIRR
jgi:large-conductance mechanosensitive channel